MAFFSDAKDRLLERMVLPFLNRSFLAPYGRLRSLRLNSTAKSAEALLDLHGEIEPVRVTVGRYEVFQRGSETFLTIHGLRTSRDWMTALGERLIVGHALRLPTEFSSLVSKLI